MIGPFSRHVCKNRRRGRHWGWLPPKLEFPPFLRPIPSPSVRYPYKYLSFEPVNSAHFRSASFPAAPHLYIRLSEAFSLIPLVLIALFGHWRSSLPIRGTPRNPPMILFLHLPHLARFFRSHLVCHLHFPLSFALDSLLFAARFPAHPFETPTNTYRLSRSFR